MRRKARIHQHILILFILTFNSAECDDLHTEGFNTTTNSSVVEVQAIGNKRGKKNPYKKVCITKTEASGYRHVVFAKQ